MVFDVVSFLAGVFAGALTGALAGLLHGLESTANVQERLRVATRKLDQLCDSLSSRELAGAEATDKVDTLQHELAEIHEEIRRMYKRTAR